MPFKPKGGVMIGSGLFALSIKFFGLGLAFVLSIFVARQFGIHAVGIIALAVSFGTLAGELANAGANTSITKWVAENITLDKTGRALAAVRKSLLFAIATATVISLLGLYFASLTTIELGDQSLFGAVLFGTAVLTASSIIIAALRGIRKSWQSIALEVLPVPSICLSILGVLYLMLQDLKLEHYIFVWTLSVMVAIVLRIVIWNTLSPDSTPGTRVPITEILKYSRPFFVGSLVFLAMAHVDKLMLGWLGTKEELGGYSVAFRIAALLAIFQAVTDAFTAPRLAEHAVKKDMERLVEVASKSVSYLIVLALPVLFLFLTFGSTILSIWGPEFTEYAQILSILSIAQFVNVTSGPCGKLLMYTNYGRIRNSIAIFALLLDVGLNFWLIQLYGAQGAAVATALSIIFMYTAYWFFAGVKLGRFVIPNWKHLNALLRGIKRF